jgi:hypothetical protein
MFVKPAAGRLVRDPAILIPCRPPAPMCRKTASGRAAEQQQAIDPRNLKLMRWV